MNGTTTLPTMTWRRVERLSFIAAGVGLLCTLMGGAFGLGQVYRSYLAPYLFWLGIALGSLVIVMLHNVTGGGWGLAVRSLLEAAARTLPVLALLFVPIAVGVRELYPWAQSDAATMGTIDPSRRWYFSIPVFVSRAALYFAIWCGIEYFVIRRVSGRTADMDRSAEGLQQSGPANRLPDDSWQRRHSAIALLLYGATLTLAAVDWVMSLDADWYSTIFGMVTAASQVLSSLAFAIVALLIMPGSAWSDGIGRNEACSLPKHASLLVTPKILNDLGNLLWAFAMIWGYLVFSQFLIIWSGNLPEEIPWYLRRSTGGWEWLVVVLVALYVVPFVALVSRLTKRSVPKLAGVAGGILFMSFVAQFWTVLPAFYPGQLHLHWLDVSESVALSGVWLATFAHQMKLRVG